MVRRMVVAVLAAGCVLAVLAALSAPAQAGGGSRLRPDRELYRPGDAVHLAAMVQKLDLDWFGPYTAYLRPMDPDAAQTEPGAGDQDIPIGRLVVTRLDPTTVRAEVTFVLPKLADGEWSVVYCNPGCTKTLGDLMGGWLQVGPPPVVPVTTVPPTTIPTTVVRPTTTVRPAPVTTAVTTASTTGGAAVTAEPAASVAVEADEGATSEVGWWIGGVVVLAAVAAGAALAARRGSGRRSVTTSITSIPANRDGDAGGAERAGPDGAVLVVLEPSADSDDEPIGAGR